MVASGEAKAPGAKTSTLKINSIRASSRAASTSRIPERSQCRRERTQAGQYRPEIPPKGIHFGTRALPLNPVRCAKTEVD